MPGLTISSSDSCFFFFLLLNFLSTCYSRKPLPLFLFDDWIQLRKYSLRLATGLARSGRHLLLRVAEAVGHLRHDVNQARAHSAALRVGEPAQALEGAFLDLPVAVQQPLVEEREDGLDRGRGAPEAGPRVSE